MKTNHNLYRAFDPGKGYRLLSIGEKTIPGVDEVHPISHKWIKVSSTGIIKAPDINYHVMFPFGFYRRKIK